jgi:hypothetical protein
LLEVPDVILGETSVDTDSSGRKETKESSPLSDLDGVLEEMTAFYQANYQLQSKCN